MKLSWLNLTILILATYRLALMVSKEAGPGWMFKHFRKIVKRSAPKSTHMDDGIQCLWCVSMQLAIVVAISAYFWLGNAVYDVIVLALAISGGAVIMNQQFTNNSHEND